MAAGREIDTVEALADDGATGAGAAGAGGCRRFAVRLLHARLRHEPDGGVLPAGTRRHLRSARPRRQPLPLHGLPAHRRRRAIARTRAARQVQRAPAAARAAAGRPWPSTASRGRPASTRASPCSASNPTATLVAGGTDLGVERNLRQRRWPHLVSVEAIEELHTLDDTPECVRIGAALPLADLLRGWSDAPEAVREWVDAVCVAADPSPRHAGRQSGDCVAHRRRRAAAAGTRRLGRDREPRRRRCRRRRRGASCRSPTSSPATARRGSRRAS